MNAHDLAQAKSPELRASLAALRRAAALARKTAIQTDTELVIVRDGQLISISADQLRQEAQDQKAV
ncbi:hypothetical protein XSP_001185 [Xanthomonas euroxanthea]|uniref:Uncharacterized protein n=1 Tax=Xanthomonas euroxanthea TaxID=2259622 RepID=A0A8E4ELS7_9XANT|nr:hypothetical protein [Xanthomonas euroxanthea]CAD1789123.1 hypothetical protein XSP_001185 [Xanthomonas euroxanthea]SYZ52375.1 hypothetical protein CPBF367_11910 [Xanthomonas arboricola pv. juglandis]